MPIGWRGVTMEAKDNTVARAISRERFSEPNQKITAEEALELLRNGRGETVDWLPGRAQVEDIAAVLVAMANSHGGNAGVGGCTTVGQTGGHR